MKRNKIVVVGAAIVDILVRGASPEAFFSGSWPAKDIRMSVGGDGINEASVLGRLGVPVHLETLLSDDEGGVIVRNHCRRNFVEIDEKQMQREAPTGINVVLVEEDGERSFITNPHGTLRELRPEHISLPFPEDAGILSFAGIFIYPHFGNRELAGLFAAAKAQDMTVCADMTKCKNGERVADIADALAYVDYILPNYAEAVQVTGKRELSEIADEFLAAGVKNVVIKCGGDGCYLKNSEMEFQMPAVPGVECVDTTGAGDCFAAGFLYGLWLGLPPEKCARIANICGALSVQSLGATEGIRGIDQIENLWKVYGE